MVKIKCGVCKTNIAAGVEAAKMIIEYEQPDGSTKTFGYQMPDGPLTKATGRLSKAYHHKHFHVERKRAAKAAALGAGPAALARAAQQAALLARTADPGHTDTPDADWRTQLTADIPAVTEESP